MRVRVQWLRCGTPSLLSFSRLSRQPLEEQPVDLVALVQRIVQRHGGHTWAQAEEKRGATFCFTLGGHGDV